MASRAPSRRRGRGRRETPRAAAKPRARRAPGSPVRARRGTSASATATFPGDAPAPAPAPSSPYMALTPSAGAPRARRGGAVSGRARGRGQGRGGRGGRRGGRGDARGHSSSAMPASSKTPASATASSHSSSSPTTSDTRARSSSPSSSSDASSSSSSSRSSSPASSPAPTAPTRGGKASRGGRGASSAKRAGSGGRKRKRPGAKRDKEAARAGNKKQKKHKAAGARGALDKSSEKAERRKKRHEKKKKKKKREHKDGDDDGDRNDDRCAICGRAEGTLVVCERCPRAYHHDTCILDWRDLDHWTCAKAGMQCAPRSRRRVALADAAERPLSPVAWLLPAPASPDEDAAFSSLESPIEPALIAGRPLHTSRSDGDDSEGSGSDSGSDGRDWSRDHNDDVCGECGNVGELVPCDGCPQAWHKTCIAFRPDDEDGELWFCSMGGRKCTPRLARYRADMPHDLCCSLCGDEEPDEMMMCQLCPRSVHERCCDESFPLAVENRNLFTCADLRMRCLPRGPVLDRLIPEGYFRMFFSTLASRAKPKPLDKSVLRRMPRLVAGTGAGTGARARVDDADIPKRSLEDLIDALDDESSDEGGGPPPDAEEAKRVVYHVKSSRIGDAFQVPTLPPVASSRATVPRHHLSPVLVPTDQVRVLPPYYARLPPQPSQLNKRKRDGGLGFARARSDYALLLPDPVKRSKAAVLGGAGDKEDEEERSDSDGDDEEKEDEEEEEEEDEVEEGDDDYEETGKKKMKKKKKKKRRTTTVKKARGRQKTFPYL